MMFKALEVTNGWVIMFEGPWPKDQGKAEAIMKMIFDRNHRARKHDDEEEANWVICKILSILESP